MSLFAAIFDHRFSYGFDFRQNREGRSVILKASPKIFKPVFSKRRTVHGIRSSLVSPETDCRFDFDQTRLIRFLGLFDRPIDFINVIAVCDQLRIPAIAFKSATNIRPEAS